MNEVTYQNSIDKQTYTVKVGDCVKSINTESNLFGIIYTVSDIFYDGAHQLLFKFRELPFDSFFGHRFVPCEYLNLVPEEDREMMKDILDI